jgi:hypothetical protein
MQQNDQGIYDPGLILKASLTLRNDDPVLIVVLRATKVGERGGHGVRRCLNRYAEIIERTVPPPATMVSLLNTVTATASGLLHGMLYPTREDISRAVELSTLPGEKRAELLSYLERVSYAEYAKLIEAVEILRV